MLSVMGESGPAPLTTDDLFNDKRVLLFALRVHYRLLNGAPTGLCCDGRQNQAAGIDTMPAFSERAFVMGAWGEAQNASEIVMVADGNGQFTDAMGLHSMQQALAWVSGQRYAMIVTTG